MSLAFKLVQKLAGFVVSAYEKEAQRLHAKVASVEAIRESTASAATLAKLYSVNRRHIYRIKAGERRCKE